MYSVKCISSLSQVKNIHEFLYQREGQFPFQSYAVLKALDSPVYSLMYGPMKHYVVFDSNGAPVLYLPLRKKGKIATAAGSHTGLDYVDAVYNSVDPRILGEAFRTLFSALNGVESIVWKYMPSSSPSARAIESLIDISLIEPVDNVAIDFGTLSYEDYFKSLGKQTRQNIRTGYNRARRDGLSVNYEVYGMLGDKPVGSSDFQRVLRECTSVYKSRQVQRYNHVPALDALRVHFHYLSRSIDNSNGFPAVLRVNDAVASFMEGYVDTDNAAVEIPRLAISQDMARLSPGMLLVNETAKLICSSDTVSCLNLLRGSESYKLKMGGQVYTTWNIEVHL